MDEIVKEVNDGWDDIDPSRSKSMQSVHWNSTALFTLKNIPYRFKGSDDYLRTKVKRFNWSEFLVSHDNVFW